MRPSCSPQPMRCFREWSSSPPRGFYSYLSFTGCCTVFTSSKRICDERWPAPASRDRPYPMKPTLHLLLLLLLTRLPTLHAADAPLLFADPHPQRYQLTARASKIDPRARAHPQIDFVFE